jgi:hypothetical protein
MLNELNDVLRSVISTPFEKETKPIGVKAFDKPAREKLRLTLARVASVVRQEAIIEPHLMQTSDWAVILPELVPNLGEYTREGPSAQPDEGREALRDHARDLASRSLDGRGDPWNAIFTVYELFARSRYVLR